LPGGASKKIKRMPFSLSFSAAAMTWRQCRLLALVTLACIVFRSAAGVADEEASKKKPPEFHRWDEIPHFSSEENDRSVESESRPRLAHRTRINLAHRGEVEDDENARLQAEKDLTRRARAGPRESSFAEAHRSRSGASAGIPPPAGATMSAAQSHTSEVGLVLEQLPPRDRMRLKDFLRFVQYEEDPGAQPAPSLPRTARSAGAATGGRASLIQHNGEAEVNNAASSAPAHPQTEPMPEDRHTTPEVLERKLLQRKHAKRKHRSARSFVQQSLAMMRAPAARRARASLSSFGRHLMHSLLGRNEPSLGLGPGAGSTAYGGTAEAIAEEEEENLLDSAEEEEVTGEAAMLVPLKDPVSDSFYHTVKILLTPKGKRNTMTTAAICIIMFCFLCAHCCLTQKILRY